jgi:hypothetical protein
LELMLKGGTRKYCEWLLFFLICWEKNQVCHFQINFWISFINCITYSVPFVENYKLRVK